MGGIDMNIREILKPLSIATFFIFPTTLVAQDYAVSDEAEDFESGAPAIESETWRLSAGGRLYDNWANAIDATLPEETHPSYPAAGKQSGPTTWRCKECHGWDFRGVDGVYSKGSHYTGIKGVSGVIGMPDEQIAQILTAPIHGFSAEVIPNESLMRLAAFLSRGQVDMAKYVNLQTREIIAGNPENGREIFQSVCAACHGFDGRLLDWGDEDGSAYIGTEAHAAPDEVLNKILNAHPGAAMANIRPFGVDAAVDVLSYVATLPEE